MNIRGKHMGGGTPQTQYRFIILVRILIFNTEIYFGLILLD